MPALIPNHRILQRATQPGQVLWLQQLGVGIESISRGAAALFLFLPIKHPLTTSSVTLQFR